jgi:hypothetical protein
MVPESSKPAALQRHSLGVLFFLSEGFVCLDILRRVSFTLGNVKDPVAGKRDTLDFTIGETPRVSDCGPS